MIGPLFPMLPENGSFPPAPGEVYAHGALAVKFYGDWLPERYECKEGHSMNVIQSDEIDELIGGVK